MQGRGHPHFFEKGWTKLSFGLELGEAWNYPLPCMPHRRRSGDMMRLQQPRTTMQSTCSTMVFAWPAGQWLALFLFAIFLLSSMALSLGDADDTVFPSMMDAADVEFFFAGYDLEGLHWAASNIFQRSPRNLQGGGVSLDKTLVARGSGDGYTSKYKLKHDLDQAHFLADVLQEENPEISSYFKREVIPIYEAVMHNIPALEQLQRTKGLYAFSRQDFDLGIARVYNKALYMTTSDIIDPNWREREMLNSQHDWNLIQKQYYGDGAHDESSSSSSSVVVVDNLLTDEALSILRTLLLRNTHWYQTKTPLEFGHYVGAYLDDGLFDPAFLELAKALHQNLPRIMGGHELRYMWAYKYDSDSDSGINLHADQAAVNVNIWLSLEDADIEEPGFGGGLVVYTAKPPEDMGFSAYNTNTDVVVDKILRPTNFANVTVKHKPNRAVIFDSALFHQSDRYRFHRGYTKGRINLTLLYGHMRKGGNSSRSSAKEEL